MKRILLFAVLGGVLIAGLELIEYRFLVLRHSVEIYAGLVAALFAAMGIWLGQRLLKPKETVVVREVVRPAPTEFQRDDARAEALGITKRELEILEHIAAGSSTREIAEKLFVSENTVKTHSTRLFQKLGARRRTQAVQIGKDQRLIP